MVLEPIIWQQLVLEKEDSFHKLVQFTSGESHRRLKSVRFLMWRCPIDRADLPDEFRGEDDQAYIKVFPSWYTGKCLDAFRRLFSFLCSWGNDHPGVELRLLLNIYQKFRGRVKNNTDNVRSLTIDQLWRRDHIPYLLRLTKGDCVDLPRPSCVEAVKVGDIYYTAMTPATFFALLACFPRIKHAFGGESDHYRHCA